MFAAARAGGKPRKTGAARSPRPLANNILHIGRPRPPMPRAPPVLCGPPWRARSGKEEIAAGEIGQLGVLQHDAVMAVPDH
ncbi:hypothetical protein LGR54_25260, partial [Ancylobacter sp. Lp-2]|uniref:hypothetical protein n=1 Tax=Ancylobacter sp. Lp-2 TaxID=2881339 RepID=UPI001E384782